MKNVASHLNSKIISLVIVLILSGIYTGCTTQLIAPYNAAAVNDIVNTYREVDSFYQKLLDTPEDKRQFKNFSADYDKIESDLRILVLKNSARTLNTESTQIAKNILGLWQKYKNAHKTNNSYDTDIIGIDRNRFFENFEAMAVAENAKPHEKENNNGGNNGF